jgi:hypothetical protein
MNWACPCRKRTYGPATIVESNIVIETATVCLAREIRRLIFNVAIIFPVPILERGAFPPTISCPNLHV